MRQSRTKEPDAYLGLEDGEFPLVVLEAGWSEKEDKLIADAQLWLHGSHGTVALVVIIVITEHKKHGNRAGADEKLSDGTIISGLEEDLPKATSDDARALAETLEQLEKGRKWKFDEALSWGNRRTNVRLSEDSDRRSPPTSDEQQQV